MAKAKSKKATRKPTKPVKRKAKKAPKKSPARPSRKPAKKAARKPAARPPSRPARPRPARAAPSGAPAAVSDTYPGELESDAPPGAEVREVFNHYDRDGSGSIERGEFARLLEALGGEPSEEEVAEGLQIVDSNHSGRISWSEFQAWWSSR